MSGPLRVLAVMACAGAVWMAVSAGAPNQVRLPVRAVVVGAVVTQPFGCTALTLEPFDPFCRSGHVHTGIDLAARSGTDVHAATGGVARVGFDPAGAGLYVSVTLDPHARLLYCHLSAVRVATGQSIKAGDVVGLVGATGLATGPHVHFEIQVDGRPVDPASWLPRPSPS